MWHKDKDATLLPKKIPLLSNLNPYIGPWGEVLTQAFMESIAVIPENILLESKFELLSLIFKTSGTNFTISIMRKGKSNDIDSMNIVHFLVS